MQFKSLVLALALAPAVLSAATDNQTGERQLQKKPMLNDNTPNGNNGKGGGNTGGSGGEGGGGGGSGNDPDKLNDNTPNGNNGKGGGNTGGSGGEGGGDGGSGNDPDKLNDNTPNGNNGKGGGNTGGSGGEGGGAGGSGNDPDKLNDNTPNGNNGKGGGNTGGSGGEGGGAGGSGNDPDKLNDNTPNGNNGKGGGNTGGGNDNGKLAGSGGDPHFKRWSGRRFAFHGECDLMLLHSAKFADSLGLDLHIRTTLKEFYSFIEASALRIGDSVLEVTPGQMMLDGVEFTDADLPLAISSFTINAPYQDMNAMVYKVDLNNGDAIMFRMYKFLLSVDVAGNSASDFADSVGLLGEYETGEMLGRDGMTVVEDPIAFGMEWQVQGEEPRLFHDMERQPQLPHATCTMPVMDARRKLEEFTPELMVMAKDACAHKCKDDFDFCVGDILLTGDVGMAGAW